jgi:hypothetical protein
MATHWPELEALEALWQARRRGDRLPGRADFDPLVLKPWLGHLNLVDVVDGGADFIYRVYGTAVTATWGVEMQSRSVHSFPPWVVPHALQRYREAVGLCRPIYSVDVVSRKEPPRLIWERLILPLASDGTTIDKLLVLLRRLDDTDDTSDYFAALSDRGVTPIFLGPPDGAAD